MAARKSDVVNEKAEEIKPAQKTTSKVKTDTNEQAILRYRNRRKNRRCRFCKNMRCINVVPTKTTCICNAKSKVITNSLWIPRIFCGCYDLTGKLK